MSNTPSLFPIDHLRQVLSSILSLASWKTLALVLAIINIKNLPSVWHVSSVILFGVNDKQKINPKL